MSSYCQFSSQHELGYAMKQAEQHSSFISSATCDSSGFRVLQEARLMLMCHQRGRLKTRFIHLSASTVVLQHDFRSHKNLALRWTVLSWSKVAWAHVCICEVQNFTLGYTCWSHIAKHGHNFKQLLGLIYFRLELTPKFDFLGHQDEWGRLIDS